MKETSRTTPRLPLLNSVKNDQSADNQHEDCFSANMSIDIKFASDFKIKRFNNKAIGKHVLPLANRFLYVFTGNCRAAQRDFEVCHASLPRLFRWRNPIRTVMR